MARQRAPLSTSKRRSRRVRQAQDTMKRVFEKMYQTTGLVRDPGQRSVASRVSALIVEATLLFVVLGTIGVDTSPLIAAAGVTGATIGFACKDFGANFVASIALSSNDAMRTGNRVTIGTGPNAVTGIIYNWDTRYLYLRTPHNYMMCVPNNLILNSVVVVEKEMATRVATPADATTTTATTAATTTATTDVNAATAEATEADVASATDASDADVVDDKDAAEPRADATVRTRHKRGVRKGDKEWQGL